MNEHVKAACAALDDKFGADIVALEISQSILADHFIIATGNNPAHIRALAENVEEKLYKIGLPLKHAEGYNTLKWVLLDFGSLIVHIFSKEDREFYRLEKVWGDSRQIQLNE